MKPERQRAGGAGAVDHAHSHGVRRGNPEHPHRILGYVCECGSERLSVNPGGGEPLQALPGHKPHSDNEWLATARTQALGGAQLHSLRSYQIVLERDRHDSHTRALLRRYATGKSEFGNGSAAWPAAAALLKSNVAGEKELLAIWDSLQEWEASQHLNLLLSHPGCGQRLLVRILMSVAERREPGPTRWRTQHILDELAQSGKDRIELIRAVVERTAGADVSYGAGAREREQRIHQILDRLRELGGQGESLYLQLENPGELTPEQILNAVEAGLLSNPTNG